MYVCCIIYYTYSSQKVLLLCKRLPLQPMRDDQSRSESTIRTTDDAEVNIEDEIVSVATEENLKETILFSLNRLTKYPGALQRDLLLVGRCTKARTLLICT